MKDINKAIEIEKEYLSYRMKGEYPYHLVDKIRECGFEDLNEYFEEKKNNEFKQIEFNYVEQPMPGGVAEIFKMIATNKPGVLFVDWEQTFVVAGNQGLETLNQEYCDANNITVFPLHTNGGTIVGSEGDFSFGVCYPRNTTISPEYILNNVKDILQKHTDKVVAVKGNDITFDGNKICGSATYENDYILMTIMHFSFRDWSELISKICITNKIGKPVSYVDCVTRDVFRQEVAAWLRII